MGHVFGAEEWKGHKFRRQNGLFFTHCLAVWMSLTCTAYSLLQCLHNYQHTYLLHIEYHGDFMLLALTLSILSEWAKKLRRERVNLQFGFRAHNAFHLLTDYWDRVLSIWIWGLLTSKNTGCTDTLRWIAGVCNHWTGLQLDSNFNTLKAFLCSLSTCGVA